MVFFGYRLHPDAPCAYFDVGGGASNQHSRAPVAQVTLVSDLVPSQTYEEPGLGYAFDYPEAWHIIALPEVPGSTVTIASWNPDNLSGERPQGEGFPERGEKMDITP